MKLLDTSVWIPFLRRNGDPVVKQHVANLIASSAAAYTCAVRFELVFGAQDAELPALLQALSFAKRISITQTDWDLAAEAGQALRKAGIPIPQDDLLIAAVAVREQIPLVCRDQHFSVIQEQAFPQLIVEQI